jgi:8-oxo-dGTP pyrophosphatase MutT (NUDIX family)
LLKSILSLDLPDSALRITGIREVFEETNLLIATDNVDKRFPDVNKWREIVTKDSTQFIEMFRTFGLKPTLNKLYPWSHWITPSAEKYRYNTLFYITELNSSALNALHDSKETTSLDWCEFFFSFFSHFSGFHQKKR